jgi:hypothetical protein
LLQTLKALLAPFPHFYIVRSLSNEFGQGGKYILDGIPPTYIVTGDTNMLYTNLGNVHMLRDVETQLDADDGLHIHYVEAIQRRASKIFVRGAGEREDHRDWMVWCLPRTMEWYWQTNEQSSTLGVLGFSRNATAAEVCHTGVITLGVARGTFTRTAPRGPSYMLYQHLKGEHPFLKFEQASCGPVSSLECLDVVTELEPGGGEAVAASPSVDVALIPTIQQTAPPKIDVHRLSSSILFRVHC